MKNNKVKVIFSSPLEPLNDNPDLFVQPARNFIPDGWKKLPNYHKEMPPLDNIYKYKTLSQYATAKVCPSFGQIWNEGYVLVAPCDISIRYNFDTKQHIWETAIGGFQINRHYDYQYIDYIKDSGFQGVFKIDNLYTCQTPKGYSIRQIPLLWHHNKQFEVAYGVIHTDQYFEINPQVMMRTGVEEIFIKQGDPICYIVPFKRIETELIIEKYDDNKHYLNRIINTGKFTRGYLTKFKNLNS